MTFCTYCGMQLQEGVPHACAAGEAAAAASPEHQQQNQQQQQQQQQQHNPYYQQQQHRPASPAAFDGTAFMAMFQNPLKASAYGADKVLNGVIGLAASVIALLLYGFANTRSFGFGLGIIDNYLGRAFNAGSVFVTYFIGGIFSLAAFIAAFALFGMVFGRKQLGFSEIVAKYGSIQIFTAAGYLVSAVLALGSFGGFFYNLTEWMTIVVTVLVSFEAYDIAPEKRFAYAISAIGSYAVVSWLLLRIF